MNFLKKGLAQVTAAVEKAREATAAATSSVDAGASSSGRHAPGAPSTSTSRHAPHAPDRDATLAELDPSALPEIRFDERDPDDEHVLFLWTVFAGAPRTRPCRTRRWTLPRRLLRRVRRMAPPPGSRAHRSRRRLHRLHRSRFHPPRRVDRMRARSPARRTLRVGASGIGVARETPIGAWRRRGRRRRSRPRRRVRTRRGPRSSPRAHHRDAFASKSRGVAS